MVRSDPPTPDVHPGWRGVKAGATQANGESWGEVAARFGVSMKVVGLSSRKFLDVLLTETDSLDSREIAGRARAWMRGPPA